MKFFGKFLAATVCATTVSFAAFAAVTPDVNTVLATVNGTKITLGNVIVLRNRLPEQYKKLPDEILFKGILTQLIQQTVLMEDMEKNMDPKTRVALENEKRAFLAAEMLARISGESVSKKALQAAYDQQYAKAAPTEEYDASHILVKTKAEAEKIEQQLANGGDFAALAKKYSTGPSGANGGDLGWFSTGEMVKPFTDAVVALRVGQISAPVKTQFGWHVIKLNKKRIKAVPTLAEVGAHLTQEIQKKRVEAEVVRLTAAAKVTREKVDIDPSVIRDISLFNK